MFKIRSVNGQFNCTAPYQFNFTVLGVTDIGGGNNNLTCAGAFELEMNKEWSCGNAWYLDALYIHTVLLKIYPIRKIFTIVRVQHGVEVKRYIK
ncbi:MAG: hypothetical protein IPN86_21100 [Saprospiraceae bacterium]|nr:hypothetical protein [Saprospiraceae bacterium]